MKPLLSLILAAAITIVAPVAQAQLVPKPNVAPVVSSQIPAYSQHNLTTRVIDMRPFFRDPDATDAVQLTTSIGVMNFTLDGETAPLTVANFLRYVDQGRYFVNDPPSGGQASLFFHRSVPGFVIQSGGFLGTTTNSAGNVQATQVAAFPPVPNEPVISNRRGTIAMAKIGGDPNSATSQWFINLADNSQNLDTQNGGFTVFGRVAGGGMATADAIAALPTVNAGSPFDQVPVRNYTAPNPVRVQNLVSIPGLARISPLIYTATSSNEAVATARGSGSDLLVKAVGIGSAQITVTGTDLDGVPVSQSFTVNVVAAPPRLRNISARVNFNAGDDVLIGGFIVRGGSEKSLIVRAIGPSLTNFGITNPIANPTVSLRGATDEVASNDDWRNWPKSQLIADLELAPSNNVEAALITSVTSGSAGTNYTAVMRNLPQQSGIGIVEIFDQDSGGEANIKNLSARGTVGTGDNIMIGGFILQGDGTRRLIVRGVGPTLTQFGVPNALPNPTVRLVNQQGVTITENDNWQANPEAAEIQSRRLNPDHPDEAAVIATLPAGNFTALLSGVGPQPTGTALVEIYDVE
jgi:cyclophilin family peptidyl-prolyl cis-trans isomerase